MPKEKKRRRPNDQADHIPGDGRGEKGKTGGMVVIEGRVLLSH
jgi:hypothetical protein